MKGPQYIQMRAGSRKLRIRGSNSRSWIVKRKKKEGRLGKGKIAKKGDGKGPNSRLGKRPICRLINGGEGGLQEDCEPPGRAAAVPRIDAEA